MSNSGCCHLTAKDFSVLESMLERSVHHDDAFLRLLRNKLSTATVVFYDDIDPQTATIDSRIDFTIDGSASDDHTLVSGGENPAPHNALPVTTLRGLALLGLTAKSTIIIERSDGKSEEIRLDNVTYQPEADRAQRLHRPSRAKPELQAEARSSVIAFAARPRPAAVTWSAGPEDDDPGPRAA